MTAQHARLTEGEGRRVVDAQRRPHGQSLRRPPGERNQQRHRADQMRRRTVQQQIPLPAQGGHGRHADLSEVDQATVDQGAGVAGAAATPVARLDQTDPQPSGDGIQGDAGPHDPAADDEHVEVRGSELVSRPDVSASVVVMTATEADKSGVVSPMPHILSRR